MKRAYETLPNGELKKYRNDSGSNGRMATDARNATTRKVADLLFSELLKAFQQR
jgi:hypothetical protein